jgi:HTH-type transcriptional regulator/antitoxin HigA
MVRETALPIHDVDPIECIEYVMKSRGLTRKDLEHLIGSRGRVADVLNRVRPLNLEMIRRLVTQLELPAEVLIRPYAMRKDLLAA